MNFQDLINTLTDDGRAALEALKNSTNGEIRALAGFIEHILNNAPSTTPSATQITPLPSPFFAPPGDPGAV